MDRDNDEGAFRLAQLRRGNVFAFRRIKWGDPSPKLSMGKFPGGTGGGRRGAGISWGIPLFLIGAIAMAVGGYFAVSLLPF